MSTLVATSAAAAQASPALFARDERVWLFGARGDLTFFGGSALLSLALVAYGARTGLLEGDAPPWLWLLAVVGVDVAHVWSTLFRVYLDGDELRRHPALYLGAPLLVYGVGLMAHAISGPVFWRVLAYAAVFHFVRQQYGWVALHHRRAGHVARIDRALDTLAVYSATLYPIALWHAQLPRRFHWLIEGDFVAGLPLGLVGWVSALQPLYWAVLAAFCARQLQLWRAGHPLAAGKILVVLSTWLCWYVGIVALNGDFAFTATNVFIHGIPYLALTYRYGQTRAAAGAPTLRRVLAAGVLGFLAVVLGCALLEELLWDRFVFHDAPWLFGASLELPREWLVYLVPLLAVPQGTHYLLDGFVWRARSLSPR